MTTATVLVIRLPLCPDPTLSPNYHGHWRRKAAAVKQLRQIAYYFGCQAMWSQDWPTATGPVTVRARIGWSKGRKRMDNDNAAATLKAVWDGFTDAAIWFDDSHVTVASVTQARDPAGSGYVLIEVVENDVVS